MNRLLIVDDYQPSREALVELLTDAGYACAAAADGRQAISLVPTLRPDLVLLDINMPSVSGLQVLAEIRQKHSTVELPVIMVTAYSGSADIVSALAGGANDYVTKPIDLSSLIARVRTQLQIRDLARIKDELLSIASHDLKNPLTAMLGVTEMLTERFPIGAPMTAEGRWLIAVANDRTRQMIRIVTDFLDMQAANQGLVTLRKTPMDLRRVAELAVTGNRTYGQRKGITLSLLPGEPLPLVSADEARITQVVENLLGNAIKFGPPGCHVEVATRGSETTVALEVRDTGPGIAAADFDKLFVRHARLGNRPTGGEASSGLGLAWCKQLVELHGGRIGAHRREPEGMVFWFELPRSEA